MSDFTYLPECTTEDSANCYWDATAHGNGQGTSFADINGVQHTIAVPDNHTIFQVVAFSDGTPGVAFQENDPVEAAGSAYSFDPTLPAVIIGAALIASIITLTVGFFRRDTGTAS